MQNSLNNYKSKLYIFFKYLFIFLIFFIANKAGINSNIYPFVFGLFFAFLWCNQNIFILSLLYLFAGFLNNFSLLNLAGNAIFIFLMLCIYGIHYKLKKPLKYYHIIIYACLCLAPKIFIDIYFLNNNIYLSFVELVLGLLYTFATMRFFESVCVRGLGGRLTNLEKTCAFVFIASMFCGLVCFEFYNISIVKFFAVLILLLLGYVGNTASLMLASGSMGVGCLLATNSLLYLGVFALFALTVCIFKTKNKYISCVSVLAIECLCGFYFKFYIDFNFVSLLPVFVALLVFVVFPNKILDEYSARFEESFCSMTQTSVINRNREMLYKRLVELSDVFAEMNKVYRSMITGGVANSSAKRLVYNEIKIGTCADCPNKTKCYRSQDAQGSLERMIDIGFEKGKVNLLDVPTLFAGKCEKLNALVGNINGLISQYKNYAGLMNNIDASKVLLAEQLFGVSKIMRELSLEVSAGVNFEKGKERKIIDELTYNNIICSDALVFEDKSRVASVTLAVRKEDSLKASISKVVSRVCCCKMDVVIEESSARAGWQVLTLKSAPKYDCIFGVATKTKTGSQTSGDCYSVIKINDSKYLFALCDGMGSGQKAEEISSTAIGLIENFYKAGFEEDIIISSVNKLLSMGKDESFSALDICVVDVREGIGNFIKMGAPESFVKHKETTEMIEIGALPLGIVQNTETKTKQVYLSSGDKIVMVTDGISDSFKSIEQLSDYINNISANNPQEIAEQLLSKALSLNKKVAQDDMSVVVTKIFER